MIKSTILLHEQDNMFNVGQGPCCGKPEERQTCNARGSNEGLHRIACGSESMEKRFLWLFRRKLKWLMVHLSSSRCSDSGIIYFVAQNQAARCIVKHKSGSPMRRKKISIVCSTLSSRRERAFEWIAADRCICSPSPGRANENRP
jgi:hypothetical protein